VVDAGLFRLDAVCRDGALCIVGVSGQYDHRCGHCPGQVREGRTAPETALVVPAARASSPADGRLLRLGTP
jgi:hypothetical protein